MEKQKMSMTDKELFEYYASYQTKYNEILKNITHYIKLKHGLYIKGIEIYYTNAFIALRKDLSKDIDIHLFFRISDMRKDICEKLIETFNLTPVEKLNYRKSIFDFTIKFKDLDTLYTLTKIVIS